MSLISLVRSSVDSVVQYFSPRKRAAAVDPEDEGDEDYVAPAEDKSEEASSPVKNLTDELTKAWDGDAEDSGHEADEAKADGTTPHKKRGRPSKKLKLEGGEVVTAQKTPGKKGRPTKKTASKPSSPVESDSEEPTKKEEAPKEETPKEESKAKKAKKGEDEESDEGEFIPKFKEGDKVEARFPQSPIQ